MAFSQQTTDRVLERTLLPFIPGSVTPNQVSWLRLLLLPFIYYCLAARWYGAAFALFSIAALTDALDGALARTRGQVTEAGKALDPIADRCLIALVAIALIPPLFGWTLLILLGALELLNGAAALRARKRLGYNPGANGAGKIKMILQCAGFALVLAVFSGAPSSWLPLAYGLLLASAAFSLLQVFLYPEVCRDASVMPVRSNERTDRPIPGRYR